MQIHFLDGSQQFKSTKPIRLIELFGGIGSQAKALKNICADFEHYKYCEYDKYAVTSYNAIHGTNFKSGNIMELTGNDLNIVDLDKYLYLLTYSFPCQDLSNAGKRKGMKQGDETRSGLLWEVERLLNETENLPQVLLMENVPDIIYKKNINEFAKWLAFLEGKGYKNYYQLLNAKHYGVAQNRNRCFMVSVLGDYYYTFPTRQKLTKTIKDYLEDNVDEKYYVSKKMKEVILNHKTSNNIRIAGKLDITYNQRAKVYSTSGISPTATCGKGNGEIKILVAGLLDINYEKEARVYSTDGLAPTCNTAGGGNREIKILEYGIYTEQSEKFNRTPLASMSRCLKATKHDAGVILNEDTFYTVRRLTPLEYWRLMDFTDEDFKLAQATSMSNSQLYKQAGNSIVVGILEKIFKNLNLNN